MPQGPIQTIDFTDGTQRAYNVNQPTVIKAAAGMLARINVVTAGTGSGTVYDSASTSNCTTGNAIANIPDTAGTIQLGFPCASGITIQPGAGQMMTVVYR